MADDQNPPTAADIEGAKPEEQPPNVVTDNSGEVPVQPVATSDPTLNDNTNPKVPFDGSDPRNIPPHDSNEQLHIAAAKRAGAEFGTNLTTAAETRREAVEAAYDNSRDVRDVIGKDDDDTNGAPTDTTESRKAGADRARAQAGNRAQPPQGRTGRGGQQTKA